MMNTWFAVMLKYLVSGFSLSYTKAAVTVGSITIPASNVTYNAKFDYGEAIALLTLVFGLYFGNKFAPNGSSSNSNGSKQADLVK